MTSRLLICIFLEPQNKKSNLEIVWSQLAERCGIFTFHRKTGSMQCSGLFFCLPIVNFQGFGMYAQYKTQIIRKQPLYSYSVKNIFKMVDFKFFSIQETLSKRRQITANFLFQYQTFYHILYPQTCQEPTAKAIFEFLFGALKIIVLIVGRKILTYLVTFKFRGTQLWCNRKGNLNGKIFNNDTKNNNYTLQCIYMITKWISGS